MRMTIAIDDRLFEEAKKLTDVKTKKELINLSLRELIRRKRQQHPWIGRNDVFTHAPEGCAVEGNQVKQNHSTT